MHIKNKRGQSTVEYVLLVTAVVAVMILFATNNGTGFRHQLNATLDVTANQMNTMAVTLGDSHVAAPAGAGGTGVPEGYSVDPTRQQ